MIAVTDPRPIRETPDHYARSLGEVTVGTPERLSGPIELSDYDPAWAATFRGQAVRIHDALGRRANRIEHVGSTAVPDLPAKPIIDIVLEVPDAADEDAYVPELATLGYVLRIREPVWFEHRLLRGHRPRVNLHVFGAGCPETDRMVRFRDWLRANPADRDVYAAAKRELAAREWTYLQQYADTKTDVIAAIVARADARGR
ncbi:MAG: GrpB family protein [Solirubrobacteraceae bacterium]